MFVSFCFFMRFSWNTGLPALESVGNRHSGTQALISSLSWRTRAISVGSFGPSQRHPCWPSFLLWWPSHTIMDIHWTLPTPWQGMENHKKLSGCCFQDPWTTMELSLQDMNQTKWIQTRRACLNKWIHSGVDLRTNESVNVKNHVNIIAWLLLFSTTCFPQTPASQMWERKAKQRLHCMSWAPCTRKRTNWISKSIKWIQMIELLQGMNERRWMKWHTNTPSYCSIDVNPFESSWKYWHWVFVKHGTPMHARRCHGSNVVVLWQAQALGLQKKNTWKLEHGNFNWTLLARNESHFQNFRCFQKVFYFDILSNILMFCFMQSNHFVERYSVTRTATIFACTYDNWQTQVWTTHLCTQAENWQSLEVPNPDLGCRPDASLCNFWVNKEVVRMGHHRTLSPTSYFNIHYSRIYKWLNVFFK